MHGQQNIKIYQLHVSTYAAVAIIRLDTIYQRSYIDMIQNRTIISINEGKGTPQGMNQLGTYTTL